MTRRGTIPAYKNVRARIDYEVKKAVGDLQGDEDLEFVPVRDNMIINQARALLHTRVQRNCGDDHMESYGMIVSFEEPDFPSMRMGFRWDNV